MFTNNYIKFRKEIFGANRYYNQTSASFKNATGTSFKAYHGYLYSTDIGYWLKFAKCNSIIISATGDYNSADGKLKCGVYFGTGSTPATKDDYTLESIITSGLTITNPNSLFYVNDGNGKYDVCADYIVRNTTDTNIVIREIGIFTPMAAGYDTSFAYGSNTLHNVLMERTVLTEPVTIPSGEARLVEYKIVFNQGENV